MPYTRWDPKTKARHVFNDDETAPKNFLPCHPDDPDLDFKVKMHEAVNAVAEPAPVIPEDMSGGMTKDQLIMALQQGGVDYAASDDKATLCQKLITALKEALTKQEVAFAENATAKELLALASQPAE